MSVFMAVKTVVVVMSVVMPVETVVAMVRANDASERLPGLGDDGVLWKARVHQDGGVGGVRVLDGPLLHGAYPGQSHSDSVVGSGTGAQDTENIYKTASQCYL